MNLLHYGSIIFLDTMKQEYNDLAWPYIGPTNKDGEMKISQVLECICIEEKLVMYLFVMESLVSMVTRWSLSDLRIIFADQLLTISVLMHLGIKRTCTLRCDYYHIVNEVWPKEHFGPSLWKELQPFMTCTLKSYYKEEY
jgi:hypothetical protein